jgi:glycosyltransferase involved in cell wall biosynthesis
MPKLSVILPVYNSEKFLKESVESILRQDFSDFELIIIDDGSIDTGPQIVETFVDPRIKFFRPGKIGLTKALNFGLSMATGAYIARMDADDISGPLRFSRQIGFLDTAVNVAAVGCWYYVIDAAGKIVAERKPPRKAADIKKAFLFSAPIVHPAAMIRMSALQDIGGYDETFIYAQDRDLFLRMLTRWDLAVIPEFLFYFRISSGSITLSKEKIQKKFSLLAVERAIQSGLFPKYWLLLIVLRKMMLDWPPPVIKFKNSIMKKMRARLG